MMGALGLAWVLALAASAADLDTLRVDDELEAALDEVIAADGLLDADEVAEVGSRWSWPAGEVATVLRVQEGSIERNGATLHVNEGAVQAAGRWQDDRNGRRLVGWLAVEHPAVAAGVGAGGLRHGGGLVSASAGSRSSLDATSNLLAPAPGWRGTRSVSASDRLQLGWVRTRRGPLGAFGGHGTDDDGVAVRVARAAWSRADREVAVLWLERAGRRALSVSLDQAGGGWRATAEAARWGQGNAAVLVAASARRGSWRGQFQAAIASAADDMPGSRRPACLLGWYGHGWALRLQGRPWIRVGLSGLLAWSLARDPRRLPGDERERWRAELVWSASTPERGRWQLRGRIDQQRERAWSPDRPWLPAEPSASPALIALAATHERPAAGGRWRVAWRWRQKDAAARHLVTTTWRRTLGGVRFGVGWQAAWGEPVDLVSLDVPVAGYYLVQHWGGWRSGHWLGMEGTGRWGWQLAIVSRQPALTAAPVQWTVQAGLRVGR